MPRSVLTSALPPVLVTAAVVVAAWLRFEVPGLDIVRYLGYLVGAIVVPGVFVWRALLARLHEGQRGLGWLEDLSLGTILGFTLQLPLFLAGVVLGAPWLVLVPGALVLLLTATRAGRRVWTLPTRRVGTPLSWWLGGVLVFGVAWLSWNIFDRHPVGVPVNRGTTVDETFHQALVADVANRFPPELPFLLGTRLDYHWFVHAQVAAARSVTGIDTLELLRILMPTAMLVLTVLGLASVALRLTGRPVAAAIAPALLVAGGYHLMGPGFSTFMFYEPYLTPRFLSSPSQSYGVMISLPAVMLVLDVLRPRRPAPPAVWVALAIALVGLSGAKATFLPIFLCGALGLWAVQLVRTRRLPRAATLLVVLLAGTAVFAQLVIFGGQTGALALSPFTTAEVALGSQGMGASPGNVALMSLAMLTGWLLYGVGLVGLGRRLLDPRAIWMVVAVAAGMAVPFVFYRSGLSQLWFSRSVAELVVLVSAWGMARLLPRPLTLRTGARLGGVAVAAGVGAFALSSLVEVLQGTTAATRASLLLTVAVPVVIVVVAALLRLVTPPAPAALRPPVVLVLTALLGLSLSNVVVDLATATVPGPRTVAARALFAPGGVPAADYVADHSPVTDVVATNIHCREPYSPMCDNRSFWVAGYTERRVVVQGWGYSAATNLANGARTRSALVPMPDQERLMVNDAVFVDPSPRALQRLVDTYGVDWLFVSKQYVADLRGISRFARTTGLLDRVFANRNYAVYAVNAEPASRS